MLSKDQKVACLRKKYYEFSQRLEFKCNMYNVNNNMIDEKYTSKICSSCGSYKEDLGGSKIYYCDKCNISIERDVNGSRNIYIKSI